MLCKECGNKVLNETKICELCGTAVECSNENGNTEIHRSDIEQSQYVDPFWANSETTHIDNSQVSELETNGDIDMELGGEKPQKTTQFYSNDPFATTAHDSAEETSAVNLCSENSYSAENEGYNFRFESTNSNYGASRKTKITVGIMAAVIAVLIAAIIYICVNGFGNTAESPSDDITDIEYTEKIKSEIAGAEKIEVKDEEKWTFRKANDLITYQYISDEYSQADENPSYCSFRDYSRGYMIEYPLNFEQTYDEIEKEYSVRKWVNSENTAILCVNTAENVENVTTKELQELFAQVYGGEITYSPLKENWFAISVDDDVYYHYAYYRVNEDKVMGFEFHFSGQENLPIYSTYIDHIYESFGSL